MMIPEWKVIKASILLQCTKKLFLVSYTHFSHINQSRFSNISEIFYLQNPSIKVNNLVDRKFKRISMNDIEQLGANRQDLEVNYQFCTSFQRVSQYFSMSSNVLFKSSDTAWILSFSVSKLSSIWSILMFNLAIFMVAASSRP